MADTELSIGSVGLCGTWSVDDSSGGFDLTSLDAGEDYWITLLSLPGNADVYVNTDGSGGELGAKRVPADTPVEVGLYRGGRLYPCRCEAGLSATIKGTAEKIHQ